MMKTSTHRAAAIFPKKVKGDALVGLKHRISRFASVLAGVFVVTSRLLAQFSYADFSNAENLSILNDATVLGGVMQLTPATAGQNGTVFHALEQSLGNGFETTFSFQISGQGGATDASGNAGGDGLAFIIQRQGADVSGPRVGYIPYSIPDCLAVEFDTWYNRNLDDPDGNHISLQPVGPSPDGYSEFFHSLSLGSTSSIPDMSDGTDGTGVFYPCNPCNPWFSSPPPRPAGFALIRIIAELCKNAFPHGDGLSVAGYRPRE